MGRGFLQLCHMNKYEARHVYITSMERPNHIHSCQKKRKKETVPMSGLKKLCPFLPVIYIDRLLKI